MKEVWKDIKGYEGEYKVSNYGRVKSLKNHKEKILKQWKNNKGYLNIALYKNKKSKMYRVHRLVALAFIPNPENLPEVNHKDEIKENNHVDNLEWCDRKYNMNYGTVRERLSKTRIENNYDYHRGADNILSKKFICVTTGEVFNCSREANEKYKIPPMNIIRNCKGESKSAGEHPITGEKLQWMYYDDFINDDWDDDFTNPYWFVNKEILRVNDILYQL